jgi:hypothetical protein
MLARHSGCIPFNASINNIGVFFGSGDYELKQFWAYADDQCTGRETVTAVNGNGKGLGGCVQMVTENGVGTSDTLKSLGEVWHLVINRA